MGVHQVRTAGTEGRAKRRGLSASVLVVAMLVALPTQAALAAKPDREQGKPDHGPGTSFTIPAGETCSFAIEVEYVVQGIDFVFSSGRVAGSTNSAQLWTNLETGKSYGHRSVYHYTSTFSADGTIVEVTAGTYWLGLLPGDQGPEGEVGPQGADYFMNGRFTLTYDPEADLVTAFEYVGQARDICEVLSA